MTTEQLRKEIIVCHWALHAKGISIRYYKYSESDPIWLELIPEEAAIQLQAIGSIHSWVAEPFYIYTEEDKKVNWTAFYNNFIFSQWEALTLVIRHEMEKELEKDATLLEMDKAIEALKNI